MNHTRRLQCTTCSQWRDVDVRTAVGGQPILEWWQDQGQRCAFCRKENWTQEAPGRVHRNGHDTEHEAADSVKGVTARLKSQVLDLLGQHPDGLTDDEGGALMGGDRLTFGRRRNELVGENKVGDSGERRPSPNWPHRKVIVWKLR